MTQQEIKKFVEKNHVAIYTKDQTKLQALFADNDTAGRRQLMENKSEIMDYLKGQQELEAARAAKKAEIESQSGYTEIEKSISAYNDYHAKFERAMETGNGILPAAPKIGNPDEIRKQYPVGAAYGQIKGNCYSENSQKCNIYKRALESIYAGADILVAHKAAEKEWNEEAERLVMNS